MIEGEQSQISYGVGSLTDHERDILSWPGELSEFQRLNPTMRLEALQTKIEIFRRQLGFSELFERMKELPEEALRSWSWEKLFAVCLGDPGSPDSHYSDHDMDEIVFPEGYKKVWTEQARTDALYYQEHSK